MGLFGPSLNELAQQEFELKNKEKTKRYTENYSETVNTESKIVSILKNKNFMFVIYFVCILIISYTVFFYIWESLFSKSGISLREFNAIENGMSYSEVVKIVGEPGELLSSVDLNIGSEYSTVMYVWYGKNKIANANVTLQGDKVIMKAQFGLN
jgi:hypothetical protein